MDKLLYVSMTGAAETQRAQAIQSNNLANVATTGFRSEYSQARAMPVYGDGYASRVYAMTESPGVKYAAGTISQTGNDLDVAVNGNGWFVVQDASGKEAYTRSGEFNVDAQGVLRTRDGLAVMGNGGAVTLPPYEKVEIGADGTVSVRGLGQGAESLTVADRIKLVNPSVDKLTRGEDGLYRMSDGSQAPVDGTVKVVTGAVEGSNVNAVEALTQIISLSRQFEMQIKLMHQAQQNDESSARVMQMS